MTLSSQPAAERALQAAARSSPCSDASRCPGSRIGLFAALACAMWAIKRHYASATVDELRWILKPVATLAAPISGAAFEWETGSGYLCRERLFLIAKPCAGVNFLLAAFGMVGFLLSPHARSWAKAALLAPASLAVAYVAAIGANALRIVVALWIAAHPLASGWWTPARVHRVEGVVIYFGVLALLHLTVRRLVSGGREHDGGGPNTVNGAPWIALHVADTLRAIAVPLVAYYGITIVVPILNGSASTDPAFVEHLGFVALLPLTLVGLFVMLRVFCASPKVPHFRAVGLRSR